MLNGRRARRALIAVAFLGLSDGLAGSLVGRADLAVDMRSEVTACRKRNDMMVRADPDVLKIRTIAYLLPARSFSTAALCAA